METTKYNEKGIREGIEGVWKIDLMSAKEEMEYFYPPNNCAELIVVLDGSIKRKTIGNKSAFTLKKYGVYLTNVRSKGTVFLTEGNASFLIIRINPCAQQSFQRGGMFYSRDKLTQLTLPTENSFIWKKYIVDNDIKNILDCLDKLMLLMGAGYLSKKDNTVSRSIDIIREKNGQVLVKDIYKKMGVCKSTLEHKFNKEVGISPKEFCRIEKLNYFFFNYKTNESSATLTELTYKSGYYDQSHLIKDFKQFVELNPRRFFSEMSILI